MDKPYIKQGNSYLFRWTDKMSQIFHENRIFTGYPWLIDGIYQPGQQFRVLENARPEKYSNHPRGRILTLGSFSYCRTPNIAPDFTAGRYCSIATGVELSDMEHPLDRFTTHPITTHHHMKAFSSTEFGVDYATYPHQFLGPAPNIGHDVWIGKDVLIKRGIKIGSGSVIAAKSVVTKDVEPYSVVGGTPARHIKYRIRSPELRSRLLDSRWWDYLYVDFPQIDPRNIDLFFNEFEKSVAQGAVRPLPDSGTPIADRLISLFS